MIGSWEFGFAGNRRDRHLLWSFHRHSISDLPRGYLPSVQQRFDLAVSLPASGFLLSTLRISEGGDCQLLAEALEGEPLPCYLSRVSPSFRKTLSLIRDLVSSLREISGALRLLSNLVSSDFLVKSRNGVSLEVAVHPAFLILREEVTKTDFEIACFWVEYVARVHAAAKDGWSKPVADYDPLALRTFRRLLKSLHRGKEMNLSEAIDELERCVRRELDSLRPGLHPANEEAILPLGPLQSALVEEVRLEYPAMLSENFSKGEGGKVSPFVAKLQPDPSVDGERSGILLPPEGWFENSLVQSVNRKMASPFLSSHPNTMRIRSLFCEEAFTLLVVDATPSIPLPALIELKGGLEAADALRIGEKTRRALDQFDSAGFEFEVETPWQIEIYFLRENEIANWKDLISTSCRDWPVWEVRIRVEVPTESLFELPERSSWLFVLNRLEGKVFPSLIAWMLEWRRFEWASKRGVIEREPISWDRRFDSLFKAAGSYFEPGQPAHRERLLSLLGEGLALNNRVT